MPPGAGPHLLGDLGLAPDGTLYAADARAGTVYRLRPGSAALDPLVPEHTFASPQTPALAADGRTLFVPDWTLGLFAVPLSGGEPRPLGAPGDLVTAGIDGLALARGPELGEPTHVVATRGGALVLVDSGWGRFADDGALRPDAPAARPRLLRLDLH